LYFGCQASLFHVINGVALLQQTAGSRDHSYRKNHQPELGSQQRRDESRSLPSLPKKVWIKPEKKKLSEKELEQKRQEMMDNARWREKERERNIANYKAEDEKEKMRNKEYNGDFLRYTVSFMISF